jgi:hypothetical protein
MRNVGTTPIFYLKYRLSFPLYSPSHLTISNPLPSSLFLPYIIQKARGLLKEAEGEEVPRRERYAARPSLEEIFEGKEASEGIYEAIYRWRYKLKEVGKSLGIHYSTVSRIASRVAKSKT